MKTQIHEEKLSSLGGDTEFRRRGNGRWIALGGTLATILIAVPLVLGWVGKAFDIAKTPDQIRDLQTQQTQMKTDQAAFKASVDAKLEAIQESQDRIERALRIQHQPHETTQ